jgi:hypothetical protein
LKAGTGDPVPAKSPRRQFLSSPAAVGLLVLAVYGLWLSRLVWGHADPRDYIVLGRHFVLQSHSSSVIKFDPHYHYVKNGSGYDGQFYYFMAVDPVHARYYMDQPSYRYARPLYPMLARLLALGQVSWIPYTLILVNWLAIAGAAFLIAAWLVRHGVSAWLALIYAAYPGLIIGLQWDLTEPLSYALVALGVYLFSREDKLRYVFSGLAFAAALLTRDKTILFSGMYALGILIGDWRLPWKLQAGDVARRIKDAALFSVVAFGPPLVYRVWLALWLHSTGIPSNAAVAPLSGALSGIGAGPLFLETVCIFIPAGICAWLAVRALLRRQRAIELLTYLVVGFFSLVTLNKVFFQDVIGVFRVSTGVAFAALYCVPCFDAVSARSRLWLASSAGLWLLPVGLGVIVSVLDLLSR